MEVGGFTLSFVAVLGFGGFGGLLGDVVDFERRLYEDARMLGARCAVRLKRLGFRPA